MNLSLTMILISLTIRFRMPFTKPTTTRHYDHRLRTMNSSTAKGRSSEHLANYTRQATILRKNLFEWDRTLRTTGEEWPKTLGRLNAALNQTVNMDHSIDDVMEHFVYLPKQSTANAQDIPFFLSTRLETPASDEGTKEEGGTATPASDVFSDVQDPVQHLAKYETQAADLAVEYEQNMVRF